MSRWIDVAEGAGPRVLMAVEQLRRAVPGGIGAYARGLLAGLARCAEDGDDIDLTLLASRAPGRSFEGPTRRPDPLAGFGRPVRLSRLPSKVLTRAWDHGWVGAPAGFDVVHSISLAAPPRRPAGTAYRVVTVHDVAWRRYPEATTRRGARWHEAAMCRVRDSDAALVVTSKFVAADLMSDGVASERITIVHGGSDSFVPEDRAQTDALLGRLGVSGEFLLTVSTLEPRKNVDRLLQAYGHVRPELPEPWPLVIVGPAGWGPGISSPEGHAGVVFAGAVSDATLTGLYRRARAFAYVPLTEGYGMPPLEAMRVGTPSVITNEVPSVVDLDETGPPPARIVDPFDVEDIAAGLLAVLTDEPLRADLARRGAAHARARSWRTAARQHIELWTSLA
jgi:glycosyltransferase involved in cell wall biosynthesis